MSMNTAPQQATQTVDAAEIAKFEAMAAEWWDVNGKFKPLHMLNPCRLDYITAQIAAEFGRDLKRNRPSRACGFSTSVAAAVFWPNPWRGSVPMSWARMRPNATSPWRRSMPNSPG
jgi:2-polyprenyl-3-methyl-5-hydroxy-6-metoxy-1,4-benzoquinol methylase